MAPLDSRRACNRSVRLGAVIGLLGLLMITTVFAVVAPPQASAVTKWSSEETISELVASSTKPVVALSDDGSIGVAVWIRSDGSRLRVEAATVAIDSSGVTWSTPVALSAAGQSANDPSLALSSDGATVLVGWYRSDGSRQRAQAVVGTITGGVASWGPVATLSDSGQNVGDVDVALDGSGQSGLAVWRRYDGSRWRIQSAAVTVVSGVATWAIPATHSTAGSNTFVPDAAVARDGSGSGVIWEFDGASDIIQVATASTSGSTATLGSPQDLSAAGENADQHRLRLEQGVALAAWTRFDTGTKFVQVRTATLSAGTPIWTPAADLSAPGASAAYLEIDLSEDASTAVAAWIRSDGANNIVQARGATIAASGASWGSTQDLSLTGSNASHVDVTLAAGGDKVIAVWERPDSSGFSRIQTSFGIISGGVFSWSSGVDMSTPSQNASWPRVAISRDGSVAISVWVGHEGGSDWTVRSRVLGDFAVAAEPLPPPPPTLAPTTTTSVPATTVAPVTTVAPPTTVPAEVTDPVSVLEDVAAQVAPAGDEVVSLPAQVVDGRVQATVGGFVPEETVYAVLEGAWEGYVTVVADAEGTVEVVLADIGSPLRPRDLILYAPRSAIGARLAVDRTTSEAVFLPATGTDLRGVVLALGMMLGGMVLATRRRTV